MIVNKKILLLGLACFISLVLLVSLASSLMTQVVVVNSAPTVHLGLSGFVTSTSFIDSIINIMKAKGLNTFRMCFAPSFVGTTHPYKSSYVQYFLDHCNYILIVEPNHLHPSNEAMSSKARSNWSTIKNNVYKVLSAYKNNNRVVVELINEYVSSDFYTRMQSLVTEIRSKGYTNKLILNKFSQSWKLVNDPLGKTYQGYHYYFNTWSVSGAISNIKLAKAKGIKLINTEIGADFNEYTAFSASEVSELNSFVSQCASLGIGNLIWMNANLNNYNKYQSLGWKFPVVASP